MIGALKSGRAGTAILVFLIAMGAAGCTPPPAAPSSAKTDAQLEATRVKSTDEFVARSGASIDPATHPGNALFAENCATCHSGRVPKAPAVVWLEMMAPDALLASMNDGLMSAQAAHLSATEREQIAEYLTRTALADFTPPPAPPACVGDAAKFEGPEPATVGWGHDTSRFIPGDVAGLTRADAPKLKLKWAFAYPNAVRARSQPSIGWNTIFIGSQDGTVYAFDLDSGCVKWTFRASAEVRTAIVADAAARRLYFGDVLGRAYAVDAFTGAEIWRRKIDDHPNATITGSPALGGGKLFVPVSSLEVTSAADPNYACCTFRGLVAALDPATGDEIWKTYVIPEPPAEHGRTSAGTLILGPSGAPVWNSPAYDARRRRLYFGTGENYSSPADGNSDAVFAVNADNGEIIWRRQLTAGDAWNVGCMMGNENCPVERGPDVDLSASPILVPLGEGRDIIVVGQKSAVAYGVDPESGNIVWSQRLGHGGTQGGVHFGMTAQKGAVFAPIVDMADTRDARVYDAKINGAGLHAVDAATGEFLWRAKADDVCAGREFCDPGISAAATSIDGVIFAGHLDGRLQAYDAATGRIIWRYDTTKPVKTITGVEAAGGSMSGPGAAVADGRLVVNSGYGIYYHMPGNVLLVFGAD
jgi:polyvinyl alcohol dehydrogenase (cytochrome)